jgi:hypothetical protein
MVRLIDNPARIPVPGGKLIDKYTGQVASDSQAVLTHAGERVRYSAGPDGADYVAVCVPAFGSELAHRDE